MKRSAIALAAICAISIQLLSQAKGDLVTLKIPASAFTFETIRISDTKPIFAVPVIHLGGQMVVNEKREWEGLPSLWELRVEKVSKKKEFTEFEMSNKTIVVKLRITGDVAAGFNGVTIRGAAVQEPVQQYASAAYAKLAKGIFVGSIKNVPEDAQVELIRVMHQNAGSTAIASETYKENSYLVANLGKADSVFNDVKLNQSARIAYLMNESFLSLLKKLAAPVVNAPDVFGVKIESKIPHKSFANQNASEEIDNLQFYAPSDLIRKFAAADITSQQFVDGSVVIVNDNRISVPLAQ